MVNLKIQKRLAATVLKCGKNKVWLDPSDQAAIKNANSREALRKLVTDGLVMKKRIVGASRQRWRARMEAKSRGRHCGLGSRKGTKNARTPRKEIWMNHIRKLRKALRDKRNEGVIDHKTYRELYLRAKGNAFKSRNVLLEHIKAIGQNEQRKHLLDEQATALSA